MSRPRRERNLSLNLKSNYFKPQGIPLKELDEVILFWDELEALRLKSLKNLDQSKAAEKMGISQSTFQRTLSQAIHKVTLALVKGKSLKVIKDR